MFGAIATRTRLVAELEAPLAAIDARFGLLAPGPSFAPALRRAAKYLLTELASPHGGERWVVAGAAADLAEAFGRELERAGQHAAFRETIAAVSAEEAFRQARDWLSAYLGARSEAAPSEPERLIDDAATVVVLALTRERVSASVDCEIEGLLGEHSRIANGRMQLGLKSFWRRFYDHVEVNVAGFEALQRLRHELVEVERTRLSLTDFRASPLTSFVRNKLIDEVYLPLVGDNLAKQLGTADATRRTDRMGMLLLISPPGYGKTTLMEYVADRLGLVFVRINCPVLGHGVTALDPALAGNSAARQELEKLNLGLAMSSNVMLYLDDIQHTSPEFLQKFIALADGTRRIEGVRDGAPRTYDLRGKRFAIVMAGNPYTESGTVFKIPDMLANRADIYNLGDVLSGREALFARSYLENSLTANPALAPLATREPADVDRLLRLAAGESIASTEFAHQYSAAELAELTALVERLYRVRDVLLMVNAAYVGSAAQADAYRTEPAFKLQGSYRNMSKLTGKVTAVMAAEEIDALLRDHYRGEAQTLTSGAEENLLKLAEILGTQTADETARWQAIKEGFVRGRKLGDANTDPATRIAATLLEISRSIDAKNNDDATLERIAAHYENVLAPLVSATYHKLRMDHSIWTDVTRITEFIERLQTKPLTATVKPKRAE